MSKPTRKTNINMRTTEQEKNLLEKAAHLAGFSNLTNFMMTAARKEAFRIMNDINAMHLSQEDWDTVVNLLSNPPKPNKNLQELFSKDTGNESMEHRKTR